MIIFQKRKQRYRKSNTKETESVYELITTNEEVITCGDNNKGVLWKSSHFSQKFMKPFF